MEDVTGLKHTTEDMDVCDLRVAYVVEERSYRGEAEL